MIPAGLPLFRKRHPSQGRWRWWHTLEQSVRCIATVVVVLLFIGLVRLSQLPGEIRVVLRQYPGQPYRHITPDSNQGVPVPSGTPLYHVTKEFGPASMGGMGTALTAMAAVQQRLGQLCVGVIMPQYSFIPLTQPIHVARLAITVHDKGSWRPIHFSVTKVMYDFGNPETPTHQQVAMYLIGPGDEAPFDLVFQAKDRKTIYDAHESLPHQEWLSLYFAKAAAAFLKYQAKTETPSLTYSPSPRVSIAQLHGATNALIADLLRVDDATTVTKSPVTVVYTMHDYTYEVKYSNLMKNVRVFHERPEDLARYSQGHIVFPSALGIDRANAATIVSRTMASSIIEGREDFYLKELVMESLLEKASQQRFFGISNGLGFSSLNPFENPQLIRHGLRYPSFALRRVEEHLKERMAIPTADQMEHMSADANDHVATVKDNAKQWLIDQGILLPEDKHRAIVLFVGRFEYVKGFALMGRAASYMAELDMKLLIIGQPNNYPEELVWDVEKRYPAHVLVMSTEEEQQKWLVYARAAADFVFVPSVAESFGLVAAEGLLFGAPVISTGVGGLKEFLIDRPADSALRTTPHYNAYLFDLDLKNTTSLQRAIGDAARDYVRMMTSTTRREEFLLQMISSAFALSWTRPNGPADEYQSTYAIAIADYLAKHPLNA